MNITEAGNMLANALHLKGISAPRSRQSAAGIIGPSDLGWCRQKAVLMTRGQEQTDSKSLLAAQLGTAIHSYVEDALRDVFPTWTIDSEKIIATFPSGFEVAGTPDIIAPDWNAIIDIKTTDGLSWVKTHGVSQSQRYQRHTYALAAIQNGLLDISRPLWVGNWFIDRSGKEDPYLTMEEFDPTLTEEIDAWISDVVYAVQHGEDAMRDIPGPVCERLCEFFTVCRGGLAVAEGGEWIEDDELKAAIRSWIEGRDMAKRGEQMKREAASMLSGVTGTDGEWAVRWIEVGPSEIPASTRSGYSRLDIRKARTK